MVRCLSRPLGHGGKVAAQLRRAARGVAAAAWVSRLQVCVRKLWPFPRNCFLANTPSVLRLDKPSTHLNSWITQRSEIIKLLAEPGACKSLAGDLSPGD